MQPDRGRRVTRKATEVRDPPTLRYKVATCLYAMAHGGTVKTIADAASIGKSTLKVWLEDFSDGVMQLVKPLYMPGTPWDAETLAAVRGQFASRDASRDRRPRPSVGGAPRVSPPQRR